MSRCAFLEGTSKSAKLRCDVNFNKIAGAIKYQRLIIPIISYEHGLTEVLGRKQTLQRLRRACPEINS